MPSALARNAASGSRHEPPTSLQPARWYTASGCDVLQRGAASPSGSSRSGPSGGRRRRSRRRRPRGGSRGGARRSRPRRSRELSSADCHPCDRASCEAEIVPARTGRTRTTVAGLPVRGQAPVELDEPSAVSSQAKRATRARPRCRRSSASAGSVEHLVDGGGQRVGVAGGHQEGGVADDLGHRARRRWRPPACRWPWRRAAAGRSPRRATGTP